jgi:hypothetical protein
LGEERVGNGFVSYFSGFYILFDFDLNAGNLLLFSDKVSSFASCMVDTKSMYIFEEMGSYFLLENGKKKKVDNSERINDIESQKKGCYTAIQSGLWNYEIKNTLTGRVVSVEKQQHMFLTGSNGVLYFINTDIPNQILGFDENLELLKAYDVGGQGYGSIGNIDNYLFCPLLGTPLYLEVFDLDKFEVVSERKEIKGSFPEVFKLSEIYHIFVGGELFLWDGRYLTKCPLGKEISSYLVKDDFIYIGFKQDPHLYAYKPVALELLGKKKITVDGYHPWSFAKSGPHNVVTLQNSSLPFISRQEYMTAWHDDEFFSDEPWEVTAELPIYTESQLSNGENFTVKIQVDADHDYIKVIRHGMAIVEDALSRHAVMIASSSDQPYSEDFNGQVDVVFVNAKQLKAKQRKQLTQGIERIQSDYEIAYRGFAHGDLQPIRINVTFED